MQSFEEYLREAQARRAGNDMSPLISDELYLALRDEYDKLVKRMINSEPLLVLCESVLNEKN